MTKQTFKPAASGGRLPEVEYESLIYNVGTEIHYLALHKGVKPDEMKRWYVSEPISGLRVCSVFARNCRGRTISYLSKATAREAAIATLNALVERVGSDCLNTVIGKAIAK